MHLIKPFALCTKIRFFCMYVLNVFDIYIFRKKINNLDISKACRSSWIQESVRNVMLRFAVPSFLLIQNSCVQISIKNILKKHVSHSPFCCPSFSHGNEGEPFYQLVQLYWNWRWYRNRVRSQEWATPEENPETSSNYCLRQLQWEETITKLFIERSRANRICRCTYCTFNLAVY